MSTTYDVRSHIDGVRVRISEDRVLRGRQYIDPAESLSQFCRICGDNLENAFGLPGECSVSTGGDGCYVALWRETDEGHITKVIDPEIESMVRDVISHTVRQASDWLVF